MNDILTENNDERNLVDENISSIFEKNYYIDDLLEMYVLLSEYKDVVETININERIKLYYENNQLKVEIECGDKKINHLKEEVEKIIYNILIDKIGENIHKEIEEYKRILNAKREYIIFENKIIEYYDFLYENDELNQAFYMHYNDYYQNDIISEFLQNIEFDYSELPEPDQKEYEETLVQIKLFKQKKNYQPTIYNIEKSQTIFYLFNFMFMPVEEQKRFLFIDPKNEELKRLCSKTFLLLRKQKKGEIIESEILEAKEKILNEAEKLCAEVKIYNKQAATITYDIIKAYFKKMGYGENLWNSKRNL